MGVLSGESEGGGIGVVDLRTASGEGRKEEREKEKG
jgi:hypothetical protein